MAGPRPKTLKSEKYKRRISNRTFTYTLNLLENYLSLEAAANTVYTSRQIISYLLYLCIKKEYAQGGMTILSNKTKCPKKVPTGRTLRNRLQTTNAKDIQTYLTEANNALLNKLRKLGHGIFKRKVTVAIDFTRNLFYGDHEHTPRVRGGKYEKGTRYAYIYASIHIVEAGKRITICPLPIDEFTEKVDVVEKLLSEAKARGVHVGYVLLDREFHTQEVVALLKSLHLKYITPAVKRKNVKDVICKYHNKEAPSIVKNFPLGKTCFNLVIYDKPKEKQLVAKGVVDCYFVFATNLPLPQTQCLYSFIPKEYRRRWGIETGFRVQDNAEPKTTSTNYAYRLLLHLCSVLIYNIWQYTNLLLAKVVQCPLVKPLVALKIVASRFETLIIDGPGPPDR